MQTAAAKPRAIDFWYSTPPTIRLAPKRSPTRNVEVGSMAPSTILPSGPTAVGGWLSKKSPSRPNPQVHDAPWRIDEIRELEKEVTQLRKQRNEETPGRYSHEIGTYFQGRTSREGFVPIDDVVLWSKTSRGGRQFQLLRPPPDGGCMRWGLCEPPSDASESDQTDEDESEPPKRQVG